MKKILFPLFLSFVAFYFVSCSGDRVSISSFSPEGEVEELTTFQIEFDQDLAPLDSLDEWSAIQYVEFEPSVQGKFKWLTGNTLLFSPEQPLKPGQDYTARVTDKVLFDSQLKSSFEAFSFHTPYFDATDVEFFWTQIPRSEFKVTVQANIQFNYAVDPALISDYIEVSKGGAAVKNYEVVSKEPSKTIAINFGEQQQTEKDQPFEITIKSGLKSVETSRELADNRKFDVTLASLTRLAITNVSAGFDGTKGWIEVYTTQPVDEEKVASFVSVEPRRKLKFIQGQNFLRMEAAFEPGSEVELAIKKGLPGLYGGKLEDEYTQRVGMADLNPKLEFADKQGQYLMRGGLENLKVNAVNVNRVDFKVYKVYANNLLFYLYNNNGSYYSDNCCGANANHYFSGEDGGSDEEYYDDYYYDDYYYGSGVSNYGKLIHSDSVILGDYQNAMQDFTLNMGDHLDTRFKGIFVAEVRDNRDYWRNDKKVFSISDLGIIARRSHNELLVFVNSISGATPVEGVDIALISSNNQPLVQGKTDGTGLIRFENIQDKIDDFSPRMITAIKGDDFNFIDFKDTGVELSRYDVGGKTEYSPLYDTYIYADRNLFRPGETANFNAIVRTKDIENVKDLPILFKVINPRGKTFGEYKQNVDREGSAELDVKLPAYASTGTYTLEAYASSDHLLGTYSFSVEEFVPDKIRVEADGDKKSLSPSEEIGIKIFSEYLFGAPCADCRYEVDVNLRHAPFRSKKYANYNFYSQGVSNEYLGNEYSDGSLDSEGKADFTFKAPEGIETRGVVNATAYVSVFDATGRTVSRSVPFKVFPNDYFVGIRRGSYYYGVGSPISFNIAAVNSEDEALSNFPVEVELIRYEWRTVLKKNSNGNYYYQSERQKFTESTDKMTLSGAPKAYNFTVKRSGSYEVRARRRGSDRYVSTKFYAYGSSYATATSFQVDKEGRVEIVADKENYEPGDKAKILFTTPFSGRMLVTIERERVMEHRYIDVVNNSAELELDITDEHLPNIYINATLFKGHSAESATPFLVGHGYAPIKVDRKDYKLEVEIAAPERIKPRQSQEIVIKTAPEEDIQVTLAVVDEGILQIKNYKTPDPYAYMYARRKLSVSSYDLYEMLLGEELSSAPAGGDEESAKRANPITAQRFKLLSFWSGVRRSNSSGEVRVRVPIPQFNGQARIMAVAYKGKRFGSADKKMYISDDVVVMPAIPRFLSPGDSIILPVSLMNTTEKSGNLKVNVKTEGPLKVTSGASQSVKLGSKDNKNVKFGIQASKAVGVGKIIISTTGMDNVKEDVEISIRPTSPLAVEEDGGMVKAGQNKTVKIPSNYIKSTQNTRLTISKFPAVKFAGNLKYLVKYPHGCVEQTTSKLFPQLYFEDLAAAVAPDMLVNGNPVYFVKEGIRKLQSMQLSDGSLAYWQGGTYTSWWGSVYAAHFLVEAKKAGYNVNESTLRRLLNFLAREAAKKETYSYRYYRSGGQKVELRARKEIVYSLYVLSLADRADLSLMNYYKARPHLLTGDARYLLGGAFALQNKWNAYKELVPESFLAEKPERETGRSFDSDVRANAVMLSVLCDVDPSNKQIPEIVRYLTQAGRRIYSTQDRSWVFMALGKAASKNANANVKVVVSAGGKTIGTYDNQTASFSDKAMNGQQLSLQATGDGSVYYFWSTEGVKATGDADIPDVDENIKVRRKYYTREGVLNNTNKFKQGDLVVCEISLSSGIRAVNNLAISDLVPAGFEIENPRLSESTSLNWIKKTLYPEYMDVRDDRIVLFTGIGAGDTRKFYYMLRVVNAGKFRLAPIGAEAMYSPEFRSYNGAQTLMVEPR